MERRSYTGRNKEKKRVLRRSGKTPELHCMLIPTHRETLLLPTSAMAEVVDYTAPRPAEDAPPQPVASPLTSPRSALGRGLLSLATLPGGG